MTGEDTTSVIDKSYRFVTKNHFERMLKVFNDCLSEVYPSPYHIHVKEFHNICNSYNQGILDSWNTYGDDMVKETKRILNNVHAGTHIDKNAIMDLAKKHLGQLSERCKFDNFIAAFKRKLASYGMPFEESAYNLDLYDTSVGVLNKVTEIQAKIRNEIDIILLHRNSSTITYQSKVSQRKTNFCNRHSSLTKVVVWVLGFIISIAASIIGGIILGIF